MDHQAFLQDRFPDLRLNKRHEAFSTYAQELCLALLAIPNGVVEGFLLNRLKVGISAGIRDQSQLSTGSFNEVAVLLSKVFDAQLIKEAVEKVNEARLSLIQD